MTLIDRIPPAALIWPKSGEPSVVERPVKLGVFVKF